MSESTNSSEYSFQQSQREAIFDFLLLAMYADSSLRLAEDRRVYELISPLGWESYQDSDEYAETATARVRAASETSAATEAFLGDLNTRLATAEARNLALSLARKLAEADDTIQSEESQLLAAAKAAFGV